MKLNKNKFTSTSGISGVSYTDYNTTKNTYMMSPEPTRQKRRSKNSSDFKNVPDLKRMQKPKNTYREVQKNSIPASTVIYNKDSVVPLH